MGQGVSDKLAPTKSLVDLLNDGWVYYHYLGMTYQEYWFERTELVEHYRKLDKLIQKRENERDWRLGAYIYNAILCASPILNPFAKRGTKPLPYMEKPFPISEEEIEKINEDGVEKRHNNFLNYLHKIAKKSGGHK